MKYYFDTSSLVKIYHREEGTETVLNIYKGHDEIVISELSKIEFISTIYRKYREHEISHETLTVVIQKYEDDLKSRYDEILKFSSLVIDEAWNLICRISEKYSLKTQDGIQLAFFKIYCETDTVFVCSDDKFVKIIEN
jgi:predicted nucleic acid-binding protein